MGLPVRKTCTTGMRLWLVDVVDGVDLVEEGRNARLHVRLRDTDELGLVARDVDVAAVGDPRHDELWHPPQQLLVVERLAQLLRRLEEEREPPARRVQRLLGVGPLDDRREVVRDRPREEHVAVAPAMRRVAVQREPPERPPTADEREKGEGPDSLLAHDALEGRLVAGCGKVLHEHRLRILGVRRPWRAALRERAIAVGEPAPGAEAEHARVVGQQDRGPVGAGRLEKRVERGLEHLVERLRAGDGVGKAVDRVEIAQPRASSSRSLTSRAVPSMKRSSPASSRTADPLTSNQAKLPPPRRSLIVTASTSVPAATSFHASLARPASSGCSSSPIGTPTSRPAPSRCEPRTARRRRSPRSGRKGDEVVRALDDEPTDGIVDTLSRGRGRLRPAARCSAPQSALCSSQFARTSAEWPATRLLTLLGAQAMPWLAQRHMSRSFLGR